VGGTLSCRSDCTYDESGCSASADCGNGVVEGSEQCDDGNTTGGDGCSGSCQWESTCSAGAALACGGSDGGNLFLASNHAEYYSCGTEDATGGDKIFSFTPSSSGVATVFLDVDQDGFLGDNLDLYVLEGACNPTLCVSAGEANGDDTVNFNVSAGLTYFLVVELEALGFPPSGAYAINLTCP
jgi:cysteine-rich repeat protein